MLPRCLLIPRLSEQRIWTVLLIQWFVNCPRNAFSSWHGSLFSPLGIVIATDLQRIVHLNHWLFCGFLTLIRYYLSVLIWWFINSIWWRFVKLLLPYLHQDWLRLFSFHAHFVSIDRFHDSDLHLIDMFLICLRLVKFGMVFFLEESMNARKLVRWCYIDWCLICWVRLMLLFLIAGILHLLCSVRAWWPVLLSWVIFVNWLGLLRVLWKPGARLRFLLTFFGHICFLFTSILIPEVL